MRYAEEWESKPGDLNVGGVALSEKDIGRSRPPKKRQFPFGFAAPALTRNARVRNRHRGSVARHIPGKTKWVV